MQAKLEAANQEDADKKAALIWNERFKDKANLKDPELMEQFWTMVKDRLVMRYGTVGEAYVHICKGEDDPSFTFAQFTEILKWISVIMDTRSTRSVFDKATGGERTLGFEQLKELLLQKTIMKLQRIMEGCSGRQERVKVHVGAFLRHVVLQDAKIVSRAVDRFQRKLTVDFIRFIFKLILTETGRSAAPNIPVTSLTFRRVTKKAIGNGILAYDAVFMVRLFRRIERLNVNVAVCDVIATLLLLSPENDRCKKVALLFEVFDSDYDGCLLWDQVSGFLFCLCKQRVVAEETSLVTDDLSFQDELSKQEGLHAYEQTRWHLQRGTNLEGEIVSLREFWMALRKQDALMSTLLPGSIPMGAWSTMHAPGENDVEALPDATLSPESRTPSRSGRRAQTAPASAVEKALKTPDSTIRTLKFDAGPQSAMRPGSRGTLPNTFRKLSIDEPGDVHFKGQRTRLFNQSLQNFGQVRMTEFVRGWIPPKVGQLEGETDTGMPSTPPGTPAVGGSPGMSRSSTAPGRISRRQPPTPAGSPASPGARRMASPSGIDGGFPGISQTMRTQKWGQESVDRFRLFASMKGGLGKAKMTPDKGVNFICQLCQTPHLFGSECK